MKTEKAIKARGRWVRWYSKPENKQKTINRASKWLKNHPEYNRKRCREFYQKNKTYCKLKAKAREERVKAAGGLKVATIQSIYEENIKLYGTLTCIYCLKPIEFGNDSLEHILPLSRGGMNNKENLAIACMKCNFSKGSKTVEEFNEYRGFIA